VHLRGLRGTSKVPEHFHRRRTRCNAILTACKDAKQVCTVLLVQEMACAHGKEARHGVIYMHVMLTRVDVPDNGHGR